MCCSAIYLLCDIQISRAFPFLMLMTGGGDERRKRMAGGQHETLDIYIYIYIYVCVGKWHPAAFLEHS